MKGSVLSWNYPKGVNMKNLTVKSKIFLLWWQSNVQRSRRSWKMLWSDHWQVKAACKTIILNSLSAEMYDPSRGLKCCANKEVADEEQKCCGNSIIPKSRSCCRPRNYLQSSVGFSYNPRSQGLTISMFKSYEIFNQIARHTDTDLYWGPNSGPHTECDSMYTVCHMLYVVRLRGPWILSIIVYFAIKYAVVAKKQEYFLQHFTMVIRSRDAVMVKFMLSTRVFARKMNLVGISCIPLNNFQALEQCEKIKIIKFKCNWIY